MTEPPSWPTPGGDPRVPPPPPPPQYGAPQYGAPPPQYAYPGGYAQPYAMSAPKPGIIPLRPLSVGEILDGAFSTIRRNPKAVLGFSAAIACVQQGLILAWQAAVGTLHGNTNVHVRADGTTYSGLSTAPLTTVGVTLIIAAACAGILTGLLAPIMSDSILGHDTSAASAWQRVRPQVLRLIGFSILVALAEYVGLLFCIVPGVFLWVVLSLTVPAMVLERTTGRTALRRSRQLVSSSFWRVFGIRALGELIARLLAGVLSLPVTLFMVGDIFRNLASGNATPVTLSNVAVVVIAVVAVLAATLTGPIRAGVLTLLYVDRRIRAEALDVQLQQAASGAPSTFGATTFG